MKDILDVLDELRSATGQTGIVGVYESERLVYANSHFIHALVNNYASIAAELRAARWALEISDEFLNDFLHNRTCVPGKLERAIDVWRWRRSENEST